MNRKRMLAIAAGSMIVIGLVLLTSGVGSDLLWAVGGGMGNQALPVPTAVPSTAFDPQRAFNYLQAICSLGPRLTASPAMIRQQEILKEHFQALGATVELQPFTFSQPSLRGQTIAGANLLVRWHPQATRRVLLGAHYDTRPRADEEPIARNREKVFIGANDGASGVAFFMELGRLLPNLPLNVGVDFVLFDAEEYIWHPADSYFAGSQHFVAEYVKQKPAHPYEAIIVVDMIADRDLEIFPEERSITKAGRLVEQIWDVAKQVQVPEFAGHPAQPRYDVLDDHTSFHAKGIPAIVLIDFHYPHWHRISDTPERCSGESMAKVARVLVAWLKQL